MKTEIAIRKQIFELEHDTKLLQKIVFIRKQLLSCGAYSNSNMELQNTNFTRLNVPQWEKQIIFDSWNATKLLSHKLLKRLETLNKDIMENEK